MALLARRRPAEPSAPEAPAALRDGVSRAFWLRQLYQWHWISSAVCLAGMLLFAVTGVTLNHADAIPATPVVAHRTVTAPPEVQAMVGRAPQSGSSPAPKDLQAWLSREFRIDGAARPADWSQDEMNLSLPRPGGDAWLRIDRTSGQVEYEKTTRGVLSLLNDLHKGRNAGPAWSWFLDIFAGCCVLFCVTGLLLLQMHAKSRSLTWPAVGLGLLAPVILILLFVHL